MIKLNAYKIRKHLKEHMASGEFSVLQKKNMSKQNGIQKAISEKMKMSKRKVNKCDISHAHVHAHACTHTPVSYTHLDVYKRQ